MPANFEHRFNKLAKSARTISGRFANLFDFGRKFYLNLTAASSIGNPAL